MKHKIMSMLVLLVIFTSLPIQEVQAKALGGFSKLLDDYYQSDRGLYSSDDLELLAQVMYHENYCNGDYIMLLTGSVVLNRTTHKYFPNTIREVLYQKGQYATTGMFFTREIPKSVYALAKQLLTFGSIAPNDVIFQAMFKQGSGVWYVENGEYFCYE